MGLGCPMECSATAIALTGRRIMCTPSSKGDSASLMQPLPAGEANRFPNKLPPGGTQTNTTASATQPQPHKDFCCRASTAANCPDGQQCCQPSWPDSRRDLRLASISTARLGTPCETAATPCQHTSCCAGDRCLPCFQSQKQRTRSDQTRHVQPIMPKSPNGMAGTRMAPTC